MLNKLQSFIRRYRLVCPGDQVTCAVSGGADSMALLFALYLLKEKLQITLSAAHYNHGLRGEESDRDEAFVRTFCDRFEIPLYCGHGQVTAGPKGLEAAAREARYAFFETIPGKIATAHTADDNAETVLMHLVRGTGLKGLGGITPVRGRVIRPMLGITRQEVLAFLEEYHVSFVTDSTNETDEFLRNRIRHRVMPLLKEENPRLAENLSAMALSLRQDEEALEALAGEELPPVSQLRELPAALQSRLLAAFLERSSVKEPESAHIELAKSLVNSPNPSAKAQFPGGVTVGRNYDALTVLTLPPAWEPVELPVPGSVQLHGWEITCTLEKIEGGFTVQPCGTMYLRPRREGDTIRLPGGTKSLKKLFIDKKIPAWQRSTVPVLADSVGVLAVCGIGVSLDRVSAHGVSIEIKNL